MSHSYQQIIQKMWKTLNPLKSTQGKNIILCEKVFEKGVDFFIFQVSPV